MSIPEPALTAEQAQAAWDILVREAGATNGGRSWQRDEFLYAQRVGCTEFRFGGKLGFGGKFWVTRDRAPFVNCYREHEKPERLAIIERTNAALAELFVGWGG